MYIPELDEEMAILGVAEAESLLQAQKDYWNVISILDGVEAKPRLTGARRVLVLRFDDIEDTFWFTDGVLATESDIKRALRFSRLVRNEPLLIHCTAGVSRSTAVAWILIYAKLRGQPGAAALALEIVRRLRPQLVPNKHVLRLGVYLLARNPEERSHLYESLSAVL